MPRTYPSDYLIQAFDWKNKTITIKMAPGGGFLLKLVRMKSHSSHDLNTGDSFSWHLRCVAILSSA
jgi:hypothetical protein